MVNIWSGSKELNGFAAALTNPTELAKRKGNLINSYPVKFRNRTFIDAESAYKFYKTGNLVDDMKVMTEIITAKLQQYPRLKAKIKDLGGILWLENCHHIIGIKRSRWEGYGRNSNFIICLINAYISS